MLGETCVAYRCRKTLHQGFALPRLSRSRSYTCRRTIAANEPHENGESGYKHVQNNPANSDFASSPEDTLLCIMRH